MAGGSLRVLLSLLVSGAAVAQAATVPASRTRARSSLSTAAEKPAPANPWIPGVSLAYSSVTDINDKNDNEKMYSHSVGLEGDWSLGKSFSASLVAGGSYVSVNNEIIKDEKSHLTDTFAGLGYKGKISAHHKVELQAGVFAPTGEDSQFEGYKGRYVGVARWRSKLTSWWGLDAKISGQYIANTYSYSPTTFELNKQYLTDYGLGTTFSYKAVFVSAGGGARISTFIDGQSELSYFNNIRLGVHKGGFSAIVAFMNGSYRDDQRLQAMWYDHYKRLVELAIVYAF